MPRLSKDQIVSLKQEYKDGIKPAALLGKYNITKHALYHHVGGSKKTTDVKPVEEPQTELVLSDTEENLEKIDKNFDVDPLLDFDQMMSSTTQPTHNSFTDDDIMNLGRDDNDIDMFHPSNLFKNAPQPAPKPAKGGFSIKGLLSGKGLGTDDKKTPEQIKKEVEQEQLKLVYQVRLYLYTFREHEHLFHALSIENEDKKINKYIQDLYKKKSVELKKILDFIKFHIRHNNHSVTGNFISSIFFTLIKVIEVIVTRMGIDLTGLTEELKNDPDMISNLKEVEIEMTANKLNVGAKTDILLKICTKGLAKFTENKMINQMNTLKSSDKTKSAMDQLNSKPPNEILKEKYTDL